jgi:hypothetical protein
MNFGKWIVVAFVFFALFIATLVTVCVRQDVSLVTKEYYNEELVYQDQIERRQNADALTDRPEISVNNNQLVIDYELLPGVEAGVLKLFRPSDPELDRSFDLIPSSSTSQAFSIMHAEPGLYRARLTWLQDGKEYYLEKVIVL